MGWFISLEKWQRGGVIGCAIGLLIACFTGLLLTLGTNLDLHEANNAWEWIIRLHAFLYLVFVTSIDIDSEVILHWLTSGAIIACYGGFGAIIGRTQQVAPLAMAIDKPDSSSHSVYLLV